MAHKIAHTNVPRRQTPRVPWIDFADGDWWRLQHGEDFTQPPRLAYKTAWKWATSNGYVFHGAVHGDDLLVKFIPQDH